jgi:hypothetical protein
MEDDLNILVNGRQPPKVKIIYYKLKLIFSMQPCFYARYNHQHSTVKALPGNLTNITAKNIWHNLKKSLINLHWL